MKRALLVVLILLLLAGCNIPNPVTSTTLPSVTPGETATEPVSVSETPEASETVVLITSVPTPSATQVETPAPTNTVGPLPTPTQIIDPNQVFIPETQPNLLSNEGFEAPYEDVVHPGNVYPHITARGWLPFFASFGYLNYQDNFPALRIGSGNPEGLVMGRPEYKPANIANRIFSGLFSQQWFCASRVCDAGVYQTVTTRPGDVCVADAWVEWWSAAGDQGHRPDYIKDGKLITNVYVQWASDVYTRDNLDNSTGYIRIDVNGGNDAFRPGLLTTVFDTGYHEVNYYDNWFHIQSNQFIATGTRTTVFYGNYRLWPLGHNDNYIDMARLRCVTPGGAPPVTATPAATSTPGPGPTPSPTPGGTPSPNGYEDGDGIVYIANTGLNIRTKPIYVNSCANCVGSYVAGATFQVWCTYAPSSAEYWVSSQTCDVANTWAAATYNGVPNAVPAVGPQG